MPTDQKSGIERRTFLAAGGGLAAVPLLGGVAAQAAAPTPGAVRYPTAQVSGRRKLGTLEV